MLIAALLIGLAAAGAGSGPKFPPVPPVTLGPDWTSVGLPAMPLRVVEHAGVLWVTGADEMVAESDDGGAHWTVRNLRKNGQLLFSLVFFDREHFAAFGTAGVWYQSGDGGNHWSQSPAALDFPFWVVKFADPQHGFAIGDSAIASTSNGGRAWRALRVKSGHDSVGALYASALSLAVADAGHAVVLLDLGKGDRALLSTVDGGAHWSELKLASGVDWSQVDLDGDQLRLFGVKKITGAPSGGSPASAVASTSDLRHLVPQVVPKHAECSAPGCLLDHGKAWRDLRGPSPRDWALPDDPVEPLTGSWAADGDVFCRVSTTLRCRKGNTPWQGQEADDPAPGPAGPKGVNTPDPGYDYRDRAARREGTTGISAWIGTDGRVGQAIVESAPSAGFAEEALRAVKKWRFKPATKDGRPISSVAEIQVTFRLN